MHTKKPRVCWWESHGSPWRINADNDKNSLSSIQVKINTHTHTDKQSTHLHITQVGIVVYLGTKIMFWESNAFDTLPLAARHQSISPSFTMTPEAQSSFTQMTLSPSSHLCSLGSCVNTQGPLALNKPSTQPLYSPHTARWRLHWQLCKFSLSLNNTDSVPLQSYCVWKMMEQESLKIYKYWII